MGAIDHLLLIGGLKVKQEIKVKSKSLNYYLRCKCKKNINIFCSFP